MARYRTPRTLFALLGLLALSTLLQPCLAFALQAQPLQARDANKTLPAPISVAPDQDWLGIDGSWNTISLRVGTPEQWIHVYVSTASQQTWAIHPQACTNNDTGTPVWNQTCFDSRGRTLNITASTTWDNNGFFQLWTEKNLGLLGNGMYGWDTVAMGVPGEEGPTIYNTTIGTLVSDNFWLGHFGVNPKPTNFSAFVDPSPSYMTYLFDQKKIPSLSFAYTAGSQYHDKTVLSSLTLGGYDTSRYVPNDLTFEFAPDNERDLVVGVVDITAKTSTKSNISLLTRDQFTMYIDSTIAEIWLPVEVCEAFEQAFGLKYDNATGMYPVDDLLHQTLKAENPSITFSLGQKFKTNATVDITLPYAALDLEALPPYHSIQNATKYFPIRRGTQDNMFVFGRTFLQEAYIVVDWERQNFSVYECSWVYDQPQNIVPIISPKYTGELQAAAKTKHLTTGAIIGIALGAGFGFAMAVCGLIWCYWRRRQKRKLALVKEEYERKAAASKVASTEKSEDPPLSPARDPEEGMGVIPKAELPAESASPSEIHTDVKERDPNSPTSLGIPSPLVEVDNTERPIFEMEGCIPDRVEAGGRQLSEKESMMVRERIYNGTDPNGPPDVSPRSEEAPRRPAPISPSEVAMVNRRLPNVSPVTPRAPRDGTTLEASDTFFQPPGTRPPRDGRFLEAEDTLLSPISPLEGSADASRRRFSYEA